MTFAQWISAAILFVWPFLFAGAFWFFQIPMRQRSALAQFAPVAARLAERNATLTPEARLQLAVAFVAEAFAASRLPHLPEHIVRATIEAELKIQ